MGIIGLLIKILRSIFRRGCGGACTPILLCCLLLVGCESQQAYSEGQCFSAGVFVPYDGNIYGANIVQFFSGCRVQAISNQTFNIQRTACSSNTYLWGAAQTNERTDTKIQFDK